VNKEFNKPTGDANPKVSVIKRNLLGLSYSKSLDTLRISNEEQSLLEILLNVIKSDEAEHFSSDPLQKDMLRVRCQVIIRTLTNCNLHGDLKF